VIEALGVRRARIARGRPIGRKHQNRIDRLKPFTVVGVRRLWLEWRTARVRTVCAESDYD
jgi:hypothetical protein